MKIPTYDDVAYAKLMLEHGFLSQYMKYELRVLATYWKSIGIKPKKRKEMLYEFCYKHVNGFERELRYKLINSTILYSSKKTSVPIVIKSIPVYKHEYEYISNLDIDEQHKKILFAVLVEKRIRKKFGFVMNSSDETDLRKLSPYVKFDKRFAKTVATNTRIPAKKLDYMIYDLNQADIVDVASQGVIVFKFINELNEMESEVLVNITSFDQSGYYYDMLSGDKKIVFCADCGEIVKRKANNQMRCKDCNESHRKAYLNEKKRESRKNIKHSETVV